MPEQNTIPKAGLSDDARTFFIPINDPSPADGDVYVLDAKAEFEYVITKVHRSTTADSIKFTVTINGDVVPFTNDDGSNKVTADAGAIDTDTPDGAADTYTVGVGDSLKITLSDASGTPAGLVIQIVAIEAQ